MPDAAPILHVGDTAEVKGLGRRTITKIDVCLRPTEDPAGETYYANVDALEVGEHAPLFVVGLEASWAYGIDVDVTTIEKGSGA